MSKIHELCKKYEFTKLDVLGDGNQAVGVRFFNGGKVSKKYDDINDLNNAMGALGIPGQAGQARHYGNWNWVMARNVSQLEKEAGKLNLTPLSDLVQKATWSPRSAEYGAAGYFADREKAVLCGEAFKAMQLIPYDGLVVSGIKSPLLDIRKSQDYPDGKPNLYRVKVDTQRALYFDRLFDGGATLNEACAPHLLSLEKLSKQLAKADWQWDKAAQEMTVHLSGKADKQQVIETLRMLVPVVMQVPLKFEQRDLLVISQMLPSVKPAIDHAIRPPTTAAKGGKMDALRNAPPVQRSLFD